MGKKSLVVDTTILIGAMAIASFIVFSVSRNLAQVSSAKEEAEKRWEVTRVWMDSTDDFHTIRDRETGLEYFYSSRGSITPILQGDKRGKAEAE